MDSYRDLLSQIRNHLHTYGVAGWPDRLGQWIRELDSKDFTQRKTHLLRTQASLGGMGSIGDIVICPEAGSKIANDKHEIERANSVLLSLVNQLDLEIGKELEMTKAGSSTLDQNS